MFCIGWSHLLEAEAFNIPSIATLGYHPAALPENRGRHPIVWALALGLQKTASTFFRITEGADEGPIASQVAVPIYDTDKAIDLYTRLIRCIPSQLREIIERASVDDFSPVDQDSARSNTWRKRRKVDGLIDWRMSTKGIYNLVRALSEPYVGADAKIGGEMVKIWECEHGKCYGNNIEPGKVLDVDELTFDVKTGDGTIRVTRHELKTQLKVGDYL